MNILWFTNTPANSAEFLNISSVIGGWMKALDRELQCIESIELSIAFYHDVKCKPFKYKKTSYYPILHNSRQKNKLSNYFARINGSLESKGQVKEFIEIVQKVNPDLNHIHGTENPLNLAK